MYAFDERVVSIDLPQNVLSVYTMHILGIFPYKEHFHTCSQIYGHHIRTDILVNSEA